MDFLRRSRDIECAFNWPRGRISRVALALEFGRSA
jgi:hypothetical protein